MTRLEPTVSYAGEELYPLIKIYKTHVEVGHFQSYYIALLGLATPLFLPALVDKHLPSRDGYKQVSQVLYQLHPLPYPAIPQSLSLKDHRK